jgi:hypothetical protein
MRQNIAVADELNEAKRLIWKHFELEIKILMRMLG